MISWAIRPPEKKKGPDAAAVWKARTGVDLAALPRLHPAHPDSEAARALDVLLQPLDLHLGGRSDDRRPRADGQPDDDDALEELRDFLRAAVRSETTEPQALSPDVVSLLERRAGTLDAVADYVAKHQNIRWREDFEPRPRSSSLYTSDHLTLHRLLIGRAFLALERDDTATAARMLATSQQLSRVLAERLELESQFFAVGVERLQLALIRRAGSALGAAPAEPKSGTRERYLAGMSAEAALIVRNVQRGAYKPNDPDPAERIFEGLVAPELHAAANETVTTAAAGVEEIRRSQDGCAELAKKRRVPDGVFAENFRMLNAIEAWRRFQVLELDRAITTAVLTGRTASPCASVTITVRDDGTTRTVEAKGLPAESEIVLALPPVVTTPLKR
ncbi:MAG TPA: hypothetical protein VF883_14625 [Thermoanaerobaculia bacterium]